VNAERKGGGLESSMMAGFGRKKKKGPSIVSMSVKNFTYYNRSPEAQGSSRGVREKDYIQRNASRGGTLYDGEKKKKRGGYLKIVS